MDKKVAELLNDQINKELYSAYLYLSFADYYAEEGLDGYANYYEVIMLSALSSSSSCSSMNQPRNFLVR